MHKALLTSLLLLLGGSPTLADEPSRALRFTYEVVIPAREGASGSLDIFVPLATSDANQSVLEQAVQGSLDGTEGTEERYGNRFWHGHLDSWDGSEQSVTVELLVERRVFRRGLAGLEGRELTAAEQAEQALFLDANSRIPVPGELLEPILAELDLGDSPPLLQPRRSPRAA